MALTLTITIPAGTALSTPLQISQGLKITRIGMPASWDSSAALTFQIATPTDLRVAPGEADWLDLQHAQQSVTGEWVPYESIIPRVIPRSLLSLPSDAGSGIDWLQLRSGTSSQPINQESDRTFKIVCGD